MPTHRRINRARNILLTLTLTPLTLLGGIARGADDATTAEVDARLARFAQFLSADDLGGRGLGERGLDIAADAIAEEFRRIGLKTDVVDGDPFQSFTITIASKLGSQNELALVREGEGEQSGERELELGSDYNPLAIGGSGDFDLPLVFVGYGITAEEAGYDDYEGIDVEDKAVIILRHEPQQDNPHSAFAGTDNSNHATFRRKASNAFQHGAAAIVFVTDEVEIERRIEQVERSWRSAVEEIAAVNERLKGSEDLSTEERAKLDEGVLNAARQLVRLDERRMREQDPVLGFERAGPGSEARDMPILHMRRGVVDEILAEAGQPSLSDLEEQIDEGPEPYSFAIDRWRLVGRTDVEREEASVRNVIGMLESSGPHADEAIVIGAHYDHLGSGGEGSAAPGSSDIHNGADDNASGTASLIEIARVLAAKRDQLDRSVVFIAFTGEERGLLGSAHYVQNPVVPLEKTVAMLNLDMVGRLRDNKLVLTGSGTAEEFDALLEELNEEHAFELSTSDKGGYGPSDHSSFYAEEIPVLHFFTDTHPDYHKPSDDFHLLNIEGMRRISQFVADVAEQIASAAARPKYVAVGRERVAAGPTGSRPYFGSIPQFGEAGEGYALSGVTPDSPAAQAGIKAGDRIVRLGEYKIGNLEDFDGALRKFNAGDRVEVEVVREGENLTLPITLDPPR